MLRRLTVLATALALAGCEGFIGGDDEGGPAGLDTTPAGTALPVDHPALDAPLVSAGTRRLTVEQLRRSLPVLMGNDANGQPITWKVGSKNGLDDNADTLGEADYVNTTEDNLEPAPLYLKFIDDAARDVCKRALDADETRSDPKTRTLLRHVEADDTIASAPAKIDENLRYLKLRFHAKKIAGDDTTSIAPLRGLFEAGGWHLVCVALLTSPELHIH